MLKVSITKLHLNKKINTNLLKQVVKKTLKQEGVLEGEVSIVLGDDELLKKINKEYRGIPRPTDVLAFGFQLPQQVDTSKKRQISTTTQPVQTELCLGEIIISLDAVRRQAKEYNHSWEKELCILLIHGVLHILGYDHTPEYLPHEPMARRTTAVLKDIGI